MKINYRSLHEMNEAIVANLHRIPSDIDAICGIHRSGMLVATILSGHLNLPAVHFRTLAEADWVYCGGRSFIPEEDQESFFSQPRKILITEDAINSAKNMKLERHYRRNERTERHRYTTFAVYASGPVGVEAVDICCETVLCPRVFEWNWVDNILLNQSCIDIDGIVCRDPTRAENDDGDAYSKFIRTVPPLRRFRRAVGWFVTSRLEKYRKSVEEWFQRNGYRYERLVMNPAKTPQERSQVGHAEFKSRVYQESGKQLFVESSLKQAQQIFGATGKPVFCVETRQLFQSEE